MLKAFFKFTYHHIKCCYLSLFYMERIQRRKYSYLHNSDTRSLSSGLLLRGRTEHLYGAITVGKDRN